MNTDEQNTNDPADAAGNTESSGNTSETTAASRDEEWDEQPGDDIGNRLPGGPGGTSSSSASACRWRSPCCGHGAAAAAGAEAKKRKRNKKRKGPPGAPGQTGEAAPQDEAEAEAAEGASEGDAPDEANEANEASGEEPQPDAQAQGKGPGQGKRRDKRRDKQHPAAQRERPAFSVGEEVFGKVSKVTDTPIWVDIAGKADRPLRPRRDHRRRGIPAEGDQFIATVASTGVRGGMLMLRRGCQAPRRDASSSSRRHARAETSFSASSPAPSRAGSRSISAACARSLPPRTSTCATAPTFDLVGQRLDFIVTQYAKKGRDIVVSRKRMLEEDARKVRAEALSKVEPRAASTRASCARSWQWGVFVALPDAGGVEGLIHMTEASHDRGARLIDLFKHGRRDRGQGPARRREGQALAQPQGRHRPTPGTP